MFGIFKKKTRRAITEVKKMENRDAVEATVWVCIPLHMLTAPVTRKKIAVPDKSHCSTSCLCAVLAKIAQISAKYPRPL